MNGNARQLSRCRIPGGSRPRGRVRPAPGRGADPPRPAPRPAPPPRDWQRAASVAFDPRTKSPALACFLSLMPGLGQIYVGYYQRGFIHAISFGGLIALLATLADREFTPLAPMAGIFLAFFYLYNVIDAGRRAALYNQALQGGSPIPLPADMESPSPRGSLIGGAMLVVGGLVLLGHTRFSLSIDWVHEWWPIFPMMIGLWLIYKNFESRRQEESGRKS